MAMGVRKCDEELSRPELGIEGMERFGETMGAGTILSELMADGTAFSFVIRTSRRSARGTARGRERERERERDLFLGRLSDTGAGPSFLRV